MLNVSIVLYQPDWQQTTLLTEVLLQSKQVRRVYWIDNSPVATTSVPNISEHVEYQHNNNNIGYGAAHNIAIRESIYDDVPYHLVVNPDILLTADALDTMLTFSTIILPSLGLTARTLPFLPLSLPLITTTVSPVFT